MSNDIQKADQIAFHFYTKLFYVINDARATEGARPQSKVDKWFNLETPDSDLFSRELREPYKNISQSSASGPPPLEVQVVLAVPELTHKEVLVYMSPDSSRVRIEPTPRFIVLETWTLECAPHRPGSNEHIGANADIALPIIYKHGIVLFRSIFSLLRILPTWKFYKRLRRKTGGMNKNGSLGIQLHIKPLPGERDERRILDFEGPPSPNHRRPLSTSTHAFPTISHILGVFTLSVTYLDTPNFQLDELESLLSSRFISLDREEFVPTLEKNRQRDSISGSSLPNSSGIRSVLSRSPPRQIARATSTGATAAGGGVLAGVDSMAVAERFILPPVIGSSASTGTSALIPPPRPFPSMNPSTTNIVTTSSPSGLAINRLRKESMNSSSSSSMSVRDHPIAHPSAGGTSSPLSSSPSAGGVPIRKPSIFKSNTVSSASGSSPSLSIRQGVPSSLPREGGILSTPGGAAPTTAGTHSRQPSSNSPLPSVARLPPSPIGSGFNSAIVGTPSSLGDRRPGTSGSAASSDRDRRVSLQSIGHGVLAGGGEDATTSGSGVVPMPVPPRKRYSSSFGHRYAGSGGSSSTGVGPGGAVVVGSATSGQSGLSGGGGVTSPLASTATSSNAARDDQVFGGGASGRNTPASIGSESRKEPLAAYLNITNDDDDISIFVQDIDARKPLLGRQKQQERREQESTIGGHDREDTDTTIKGKQRETRPPISTEYRRTPLAESPITTSPPRSRPLGRDETVRPHVFELTAAASTSPTRGMMLTSQGEVDEKLSKMKETFLKSLEGLGSAGNGSRKKDKDNDSLIAATATNSSKTSSTVTPFETSRSGAASASGSRSGNDSDAESLVPLASRGMNLGLGFPSREPPSASDSPTQGYYNTPSLGLGLGRARYASASSSTLANSEMVGASQGSEEVIGKMDLYEERRRGGYPS